MKKIILVISILIVSFGTQAQNATIDKNGNFTATATTQQSTSKSTGKTFTDAKGKVYGVWVSKNGKYFVIKTSAKGNMYNYYLNW